jgi:DNA repair protein RecN (Recombination protein N)
LKAAAGFHTPTVLATLSSLRIRNLALVDELEWSLGPGTTAITGETGSGKSIIVGALKLVLGERADKTLIRSGADSCTVEAIFEVKDTRSINAELEQQGVEPCEDGQLLIKRVFSASGTNRQFINGSATTLAVLKQLGDGLVDLHGPHDHQSLLSSEKQLDLLDAYANAEALRSEYEAAWRRIHQLSTERDELASNEAALERELDLLRHQVREIEDAQLRPGEEEEVTLRYSVVANARRLLELSGSALNRLVEADDAVIGRLNEIGKQLRDLERVDPGASRFSDSLHRALAELDDLASGLQSYAEELEIEPGELAGLEERVSIFETLKRKYGPTIAAVIEFGDRAAERLGKIESRGEQIASLEKQIAAAHAELGQLGEKIRAKRKTAAPKLATSVTKHLRDLGFKRSEFSVELMPLAEPGPHGLEGAEFLFAPNPGEPAKPLKSIASSGEISRVMLAVKSSLAAQDTISLLVFDEIDANVGGEIAHAVGAKMKSLGEGHQVLCITHLPQVAAAAHAQFVVSKEFVKDRTLSRLTAVDGKARVEEIARMLGGKTESALNHAKTLLES